MGSDWMTTSEAAEEYKLTEENIDVLVELGLIGSRIEERKDGLLRLVSREDVKKLALLRKRSPNKFKSILKAGSAAAAGALVATLVDRYLNKGLDKVSEDSSKRSVSSSLEQARRTYETVLEVFARSEFLAIISPRRSIIGSDPAETMYHFQSEMTQLMQVDIPFSGLSRTLIWILDIGPRNHNYDRAIYEYSNIEHLRSVLASLAVFGNSSEIFSWLSNNSVIIVGSLYYYEIDMIYDEVHSLSLTFGHEYNRSSTDDFLFERIPTAWTDSVANHSINWDFRNLMSYGESGDLGKRDTPLRYLLNFEKQSETKERVARSVSVDLPWPGERWDNCVRIAHRAAMLRLDRSADSNSVAALSHLRHMHFAVLRIEEFMRLSGTLLSSDR